ncbi:hypothetical protein CRG98_021639 [Punica granatum]|uniref:Uncharacterized protein n=1 Tax=Punica granatum TaxID=22663 RepID=A0A2I0JNU3_PUNGR|nr:hypothetical protein CRG98_021639 [Punica granatum]
MPVRVHARAPDAPAHKLAHSNAPPARPRTHLCPNVHPLHPSTLLSVQPSHPTLEQYTRRRAPSSTPERTAACQTPVRAHARVPDARPSARPRTRCPSAHARALPRSARTTPHPSLPERASFAPKHPSKRSTESPDSRTLPQLFPRIPRLGIQPPRFDELYRKIVNQFSDTQIYFSLGFSTDIA